MAIVFAVKKWRHYLMGCYFMIKTNQKALKYLLEQSIVNEGQQKWVSKLIGFKFEVQYKSSKDNQVVDTLMNQKNSIATLYSRCIIGKNERMKSSKIQSLLSLFNYLLLNSKMFKDTTCKRVFFLTS